MDPWPDQKVPDLGTGSGNTALATRLFCEATGVDYVPAPLERGRERAAERLEVTFREGLEGDLAEIVKRFNRSGDGTMVDPSDYPELVAVGR